MSQLFQLIRNKDARILADICLLPNGKVCVCKNDDKSSIVIHDNMDIVKKLHECNGDNTIKWLGEKLAIERCKDMLDLELEMLKKQGILDDLDKIIKNKQETVQKLSLEHFIKCNSLIELEKRFIELEKKIKDITDSN